ncbi:unnamed protein product [Rhizoctonia solani]|uniref:Uncharacterized protein n=1 Tax=Rhizoctonia solani TaxID=456999 RepID=A0A8H3HYX1_9AGAM|nr:unnamed protein product [Rhizoctonia solani]
MAVHNPYSNPIQNAQMEPQHKHYGATCVPLPVYYITPAPPPRRSRFRFINAFLGAVILLWLTHHLFHRHWHRHSHEIDWDWDIHLDIQGLDHHAEGCAVWDNYEPSHDFSSTNATYTRSNKYTFSIPLSSERYHFVSWGPIDKSLFQVIPVESDKDQVVVEVVIEKDPYDVARVCALPSKGEQETYGVGIYSPRREHPYPSEDWPVFSVKVFLPVTKAQQHLGSFETRLGQFEHVFPDLATINFSRLSVGAANVPMSFEDVVANVIRASNANGKISGKLTAGTKLTVSNANAPIEGEVTLTGSGVLHLNNANSPITSTIHLKSGDAHPRPEYQLSLTNANAPVSATISQPLNSGLSLKASTVMSNVDVRLDPAYEGEFKLSNVFGSPVVELKNKEDPSGEGRERYLRFDKRGSTTVGSVEWGRGDHAHGNVDLSTVGGSIELYL